MQALQEKHPDELLCQKLFESNQTAVDNLKPNPKDPHLPTVVTRVCGVLDSSE
jgi:hypothetical protein